MGDHRGTLGLTLPGFLYGGAHLREDWLHVPLVPVRGIEKDGRVGVEN